MADITQTMVWFTEGMTGSSGIYTFIPPALPGGSHLLSVPRKLTESQQLITQFQVWRRTWRCKMAPFPAVPRFQKWGRHYLPSLMFAHRRQMCNNFKATDLQAADHSVDGQWTNRPVNHFGSTGCMFGNESRPSSQRIPIQRVHRIETGQILACLSDDWILTSIWALWKYACKFY